MKRVILLATAVGMLVCSVVLAFGAGVARPAGAIVFDGSPGVGAPPAKLGGYYMTRLPGTDSACDFATVNSVSFGGTPLVQFNKPMYHDVAMCLSGGFGQGGGNNYPITGDVWFPTDYSQSVTMTLPVGTSAFYFYVEGQLCGTETVQAFSGSTSSPVYTVNTDCYSGNPSLPHFFGFYSATGSGLTQITVTTPPGVDGPIIGEFAIAGPKIRKT
jgi:hypothetical protein